ncbi:SlyX family protein [Chromatocurvus halotolerans]|uniref:SlyX protein n=1 Tax=Chromatocurvus halotolerans TaxID=1132028 RepID=A0A4R2KWM0_9GAMM|nr:SlyX family protein [Chromatocurvus halotolerans]TCO75646.1 SlyX protein [Chromatocurvus halotolerans]
MSTENFTRAELERLQTEQAYQSETVRALNDALAAQQMQLIELRHHVRLLEARLREVLAGSEPDGDAGENSAEPPPPHY